MPDPTTTRRRSPGRQLTGAEVAEAQALARRRAAVLAEAARIEGEIRALPWLAEVARPQLAEVLGVTRVTVGQWLRRAAANPS